MQSLYFIQSFTEVFGILSLRAILYKMGTSNMHLYFKPISSSLHISEIYLVPVYCEVVF